MRLMNISEDVNKDRAWEGSNRLTKKALENKKESEIISKDNSNKKSTPKLEFEERPTKSKKNKNKK